MFSPTRLPQVLLFLLVVAIILIGLTQIVVPLLSGGRIPVFWAVKWLKAPPAPPPPQNDDVDDQEPALEPPVPVSTFSQDIMHPALRCYTFPCMAVWRNKDMDKPV